MKFRMRAFSSFSRLALLGPPGAGKTTVGRRVAANFDAAFLDIDDDVLQPAWGRSVEAELAAIGPTAFLQKEGDTSMRHKLPSKCVLALSGSSPLHPGFMAHLQRENVHLVYLDVLPDDILARLDSMKVDRIVGQGPDRSMADVLNYRRQFYERCYDLRVLCGAGDDPGTITDRVMESLRPERRNILRSSRAEEPKVTFGTALRTGLAQDGGLFSPMSIPRLDSGQWQRLVSLSYPERCLRVLERWIDPDDLSRDALNESIAAAYGQELWSHSDICPVHNLDGRIFIQELFHGPTASFKDLALSLMAKWLPRLSPHRQLLLIATSGDTGSAVLSGFASSGWPTVVLYPHRGISTVQRLCMTQFHDEEAKRLVCGVEGDFDACQALVKAEFELPGAQRTLLNGANSINWGRLLPQVAFHCSGYLDMVRQGHISFGDRLNLAIPSGNFGNALSAFLAKAMGLPLGRILCANNENAALYELLTKGHLDLRSRHLRLTSTPAIDILQPSNLERLLAQFATSAEVATLYTDLRKGGVLELPAAVLAKMRRHFLGATITEATAMGTLKETFQKSGYILDPHTAVAAAAVAAAAVPSLHAEEDNPTLISATAHPGKFPETVLAALGEHGNTGVALEVIRKVNSLARTGPRPHRGLERLMGRAEGRPWSTDEVRARVREILGDLETELK